MQGMTLIEVLIALAVLGIALSAFALSQAGNLRATATGQESSEAKTAAATVLEEKMAEILEVATTGSSSYNDSQDASVYRSFFFIDYYYSCPTVQAPKGVRNDSTAYLRPSSEVPCSGTVPVTTDRGTVMVTWELRGLTGIAGEGLIEVEVRAAHAGGPTVLMSDAVTCYDIYPSPTVDAPDPCPTPSALGGGRS